MSLKDDINKLLQLHREEVMTKESLKVRKAKGDRDYLKRSLSFVEEHRKHLERKISEAVNQPVFLVIYSVSGNFEKKYFQRIFGGLSEDDIRSYIEFLRYTNPHQGLINLEEIKPLSISTLSVDG